MTVPPDEGPPPSSVVLVEVLPVHPRDVRLVPARVGDAGIDLVACNSVSLAPGERAAVSVGLRIALPAGVEAQVRPRSGRALREGLTVINSPGTIDPGYRGPVKVLLLNAAPALTAHDVAESSGNLRERLLDGLSGRTIHVERGERIAQLVFSRFVRPDIRRVDHVPEDTERGGDGFGSTG